MSTHSQPPQWPLKVSLHSSVCRVSGHCHSGRWNRMSKGQDAWHTEELSRSRCCVCVLGQAACPLWCQLYHPLHILLIEKTKRKGRKHRALLFPQSRLAGGGGTCGEGKYCMCSVQTHLCNAPVHVLTVELNLKCKMENPEPV